MFGAIKLWILGEHVEIIRKFYTQLCHNLTRTVEIVNMMLQSDTLTSAEHEGIIILNNNIYIMNDQLLKLILNKSSEVYESFIEALRVCDQTHLYQLLHTSGRTKFVSIIKTRIS